MKMVGRVTDGRGTGLGGRVGQVARDSRGGRRCGDRGGNSGGWTDRVVMSAQLLYSLLTSRLFVSTDPTFAHCPYNILV